MIVDYWLSSHGKCGGNGGPQADFVGEQGLMNDDRLLITDGVHTENTEGNGGPQADDGGEQQLSKIGQQLKGNYWWLIIHTLYIFSGVHQATQVSDEWWLIAGKYSI